MMMIKDSGSRLFLPYIMCPPREQPQIKDSPFRARQIIKDSGSWLFLPYTYVPSKGANSDQGQLIWGSANYQGHRFSAFSSLNNVPSKGVNFIDKRQPVWGLSHGLHGHAVLLYKTSGQGAVS